MSRNIRKLEMKDLPEIWRIANLSYPPYGDKKAKREKYLRRALSERTSGEFYGCFEAEEMVLSLIHISPCHPGGGKVPCRSNWVALCGCRSRKRARSFCNGAWRRKPGHL